MPKNSYDAVQQTHKRIIALLKRHPLGLPASEIADILGIERRTTDNYLQVLEIHGHIYKDGKCWCPLPTERYSTSSLDLMPEEAMTLYLAMRLFVKQTDRRNGTAETLLLTLAKLLERHFRVGDHLEASAKVLTERPHQQGYEDIYRRMMQAYLYQRVVHLVYNPFKGKPFETDFHPFLFEPSSIGYSIYVLGYSHIVGAWRTYKLERIERVRITSTEYTIPPEFNGLEVLRNAWSIYYGEETVRVVLRFHPEVVKRVLETQWHPSQQAWADDQKLGYHCLSFDIADTTDLKPWVRMWGAMVEVLEPQELRLEIEGHIHQLMETYGIRRSTSDAPDHSLFNNLFGG
jgi:CRISPR-associated endonuclease/helicase Cas3